LGSIRRDPKTLVWMLPSFERGGEFADAHRETWALVSGDAPVGNPLWDYFEGHDSGRGLTKWKHYFDVYHRHFASFVGRSPRVLEVGVYRGGSLGMWQRYFGEGARITGVDVDPDCRIYEADGVAISIGDQSDPGFWDGFLAGNPEFDIVIDDGGHLPHQQMATLEAVLGSIAPGGVYLCEDVHGVEKQFLAYAFGLVTRLNATSHPDDGGGVDRSAFQRVVHSIHFYPFVVVIEKHAVDPGPLRSMERGSLWNHEPAT
jgi:SAM-dependent methyltransferase